MDHRFSFEQRPSGDGEAYDPIKGDVSIEPVETVRPPQKSRSRLSTLEQTVVALAAFDHPRSVRPEGRVARILRRMFGDNTNGSLANSRLEALRRYAVLYRVEGSSIPPDESDLFEASGYVGAAADEVRRLVDLGR